jgi:LytR cell envelope-related transcriptional attenuator
LKEKKYSNPNLSSGSKNAQHRSSTSSLFLNIIIVLLGIVILVMVYSIFSKLLGLKDDSASGKNKPSAAVQVEVLNGCGVSGVADKITDYLRKNNFDVVQTGNYTSYDMDKSLVIDRTGNKANAEKVAAALGIDKKNIVQQINNDYLLDCSIVIGKDYFQLKPYNQ